MRPSSRGRSSVDLFASRPARHKVDDSVLAQLGAGCECAIRLEVDCLQFQIVVCKTRDLVVESFSPFAACAARAVTTRGSFVEKTGSANTANAFAAVCDSLFPAAATRRLLLTVR